MISSLDLARLCGTSQGTVDRALHGRPGVSPQTRARIEAVARQHGYRPNPVARELLERQSTIIGVLAPMRGVFFLDLLQALKIAADAGGWRLFVTPIADEREFLAALEDFAARRVRAVLAVPPEEDIVIPPHLERAVPMATLLSPVANSAIPLFSPDEHATGSGAVHYLAGLGHRRIMHVTYPRPAHAIRRRGEGYSHAMSQLGLESALCTYDGPAALHAALAAHRPTALFCHNDWLALAVMRELAAAGRAVPDDIAVLGVDNSPTFNEFQAGITTLAYPTQEVAEQSIAWLTAEDAARQPAPLPAFPPLRVIERDTVRHLPS